MSSELVQDTLAKHIIQQFPSPDLELNGELWICPFCQAIDKKSTPYTVQTPLLSTDSAKKATKAIIKSHLEIHQKALYQKLVDQRKDSQYEKKRKANMKRVRLWIEGTVKDRRLYEYCPI